MSIRMDVSVSLDALAVSLLSGLSYEELYAFIVRLDLLTADWDFTDMLIDYFEKEKTKKAEDLDFSR